MKFEEPAFMSLAKSEMAMNGFNPTRFLQTDRPYRGYMAF